MAMTPQEIFALAKIKAKATKQRRMKMKTYTRNDVIDLIASSFDKTEIEKEIKALESREHRLTEVGFDTLALLRSVLLYSKGEIIPKE